MFKQAAQRVESIVKKNPQYPGVSLLVNDNGSKEKRLRETKDICLKIKRLLKDKLEVLTDREQLVAKGIPISKVFDRLSVYYSCATACVQELYVILQTWDLTELGEANTAIFDTFRSVVDILMTQYTQTQEKLSEFERRKLNTVTIQEPFMKPAGTTTLQGVLFDKSEEPSTAYPAQTPAKMRSIDSFRGASSTKLKKQKTGVKTAMTSRANSLAFLGKEPQTPSVSRPLMNNPYSSGLAGSPRSKTNLYVFDFTTPEEIKAREEEEQRQLQEKLKGVRNSLREGKFVEFSTVKDPRLMVAINKELCADMIQNNLEQRRQLNTILNGIEAVSANRAEAPAHLQKVMADQKKILEQLNVGLEDTAGTVNTTEILKNLSEAETALFAAFSDKQHEIVSKVLKAIQNHKPGMVTKMAETKMTNLQIDHLLSGKELSESRKQIKLLEMQIMKLQIELNKQFKEYDQVYSRARIAETIAKERDQEIEKLNMEKLKAGAEQSNSRAQLEVYKSKQTQDSKGKEMLEREVDDLRRTIKQYEQERIQLNNQMKELLDSMQLEQLEVSAKEIQESFMSERDAKSDVMSKTKSNQKNQNPKDVAFAPPKIQSIFFKAISQFVIKPKTEIVPSIKKITYSKQTQTLNIASGNSIPNVQPIVKPNISTNSILQNSNENLVPQMPKYSSVAVVGTHRTQDKLEQELSDPQLVEELSAGSRRESVATDRSYDPQLKPNKKSIHSKQTKPIPSKNKDLSQPSAKPVKMKKVTGEVSTSRTRNSLAVPAVKERRGSIMDLQKPLNKPVSKRNSVTVEPTKFKSVGHSKAPNVQQMVPDQPSVGLNFSEHEKQEELPDIILTPTICKEMQDPVFPETTDEPTFFSNRTARNNREMAIPEAISEIPEIGSLDEQGHILLAIDSLKKLPSHTLVYDVIAIAELYLNRLKPFSCKLKFDEENIQIEDDLFLPEVLTANKYVQVNFEPKPAPLPQLPPPLRHELKISISKEDNMPKIDELQLIVRQPSIEIKQSSVSEISAYSSRSRKASAYLLPPASASARKTSRSTQRLPVDPSLLGLTQPNTMKGSMPLLSLFKPRPLTIQPTQQGIETVTSAEEESQARTRLLNILSDKALFYANRQPAVAALDPAQLLDPQTDLTDASPLLQSLFNTMHPSNHCGSTNPFVNDMQHSRFFYIRRQFDRFARHVRQLVGEHRRCDEGKVCEHLLRVERMRENLQRRERGERVAMMHKVDVGECVKEEDLKGKVYVVHRNVKGEGRSREASVGVKGGHARSLTVGAWM